MSPNPHEYCTLVFWTMDSEFPRQVLGHGGVNVFPTHEGRCGHCGMFIRANEEGDLPPVTCPRCGAIVHLERGQSFSDWCSENPRTPDGGCRFVQEAGQPYNRQPVIPVRR